MHSLQFSVPISLLSRCLLGLALTLGLLPGCDSKARIAESEGAMASPTTQGSLDSISQEELYGASPEENLWMPHVELAIPGLPAGWQGARIAILSDLQLALWAENESVARVALARALEEEPELIVLLGDYLGRGADTQLLERVLQPLQGRSALAVLGDRDIQSDSTRALIVSSLRGLGIKVLLNDAAPVTLGGDTLWIAGIDPELLEDTRADQIWILETIGVPGRTPILLTHSPGLAPLAPEDRFPVILAGNTFCGKVEVPGTPRLSWLRENVFPGAIVPGVDRLFRVQAGTVLVSCGIGYGFVPLRFGAAPEVPLLRLVGERGALDEGESTEVMDSLLQLYESGARDSL